MPTGSTSARLRGARRDAGNTARGRASPSGQEMARTARIRAVIRRPLEARMAAVDENTLSMEEIAEAHSTLRQIATGHWTARVLHVATSLGLFDALGRGMSAGDLAQTLSTHPRATEMLLSALASLGFVEKHKDHWVPSAASRLFLAKNSELYQGPLITLYADSWPRWQQLEDALRSGSLGTVNRGFDADFLHSMA
ncbi:MAG: hypothetical protein FJX76_28670, partial [Armatimonadetes bacterium]|nr:hypothetical protein [Armatimonadota bacterium]